jgi:uncharacterized tellurite resistance protein B-like protein
MLSAIRQFYDHYIKPAGSAVLPAEEHRLQVATAALLAEVMRMDDVISEAERQAVVRAMGEKFSLSAVESERILQLAVHQAHQATDYYQFTSLINKNLSAAQKEKVVEYLWQVAYADGGLDPLERHLINKIADLLYVPQSVQVIARNRARSAGSDGHGG